MTILQEYGMIPEDADGENLENDGSEQKESPSDNYSKDALKEYRLQLQNEVNFSEMKSTQKTDDSIRRYIESCSQYLANIDLRPESELTNDISPITLTNPNEGKTSSIHSIQNLTEVSKNNESNVGVNANDSDDISLGSNDLETDNVPEMNNMDPNSRMYRLKMVEKLLNDTRSQRSYSTTASTIAPSVITDRIRKHMGAKEKLEMRKHCVAKGEASAVHRHRKENKDVVKEYAGWDF